MSVATGSVDASASALDIARAQRCRRDPRTFAVLVAEIALLLVVFRAFKLHELFGEGFWRVSVASAGGFALHYWLPLRLKEPFWVLLSLAALPWIAGPLTGALLIALGLGFFAIGRSAMPQRWRVTWTLLLAAPCVAGRAAWLPGLPDELWPLVGSLFLFRLPIWLYDRRHMKEPPALSEFLAYCFMLPNWGCLLFPVVDFHTLKKSFLARDQNLIAQEGVASMTRGLVQLLIYLRLYNATEWNADPYEITSLGALLVCMARVYLLYLRLSGTFHFVIGLLHLFGYDLPPTHRSWLLSSSLTDFWRRINIYWKDFMVKLVWFPAYFRWRKLGDKRAQIQATALVFVVTWFLHAAQTFFLTGRFLLRSTDVAFWSILGVLVMVNLAFELRRGSGAAAPTGVRRALGIAGTLTLLTVLWSMWNAQSFAAWIELLTWWKVG
ncbi:MAG: hypothetical protein EXS13_02960 [Planctomycetes bacterium]|nr:hypothetical protein [Planctomycetota bacterium]